MLLEFLQFLFSDWIQTIGVITGAGAVLFLALNKAKIGWTLGVINALFFTVLMFQYMLYADVILNVYYLFTSAFGLMYWLGWMKRKSDEKKEPAKISHMNLKSWAFWIVIWLIGSAIMGFILDTTTATDVAYIDSFTTVGSLIAQFLLARKIFENWYIWIFVDVIDIGLYMFKDLPMVAGMTVIYMVFCFIGIAKWRRDEKKEREQIHVGVDFSKSDENQTVFVNTDGSTTSVPRTGTLVYVPSPEASGLSGANSNTPGSAKPRSDSNLRLQNVPRKAES